MKKPYHEFYAAWLRFFVGSESRMLAIGSILDGFLFGLVIASQS